MSTKNISISPLDAQQQSLSIKESSKELKNVPKNTNQQIVRRLTRLRRYSKKILWFILGMFIIIGVGIALFREESEGDEKIHWEKVEHLIPGNLGEIQKIRSDRLRYTQKEKTKTYNDALPIRRENRPSNQKHQNELVAGWKPVVQTHNVEISPVLKPPTEPTRQRPPLISRRKVVIIKQPVRLAIQTVFIMKQNLPFLREWLAYHINLGFQKFYLYDNTGTKGHVTIPGISFATQTVNKYNFQFNSLLPYSEESFQAEWTSILEQYGRYIVYQKWTPKDKFGNIIYAQPTSILHYVQNHSHQTTYTAFIDIDQYLFSPSNLSLKEFIKQKSIFNYTKYIINQKKFEDRYCNPGKKVTTIYNCIEADTEFWAQKLIIQNRYIERQAPFTVHAIKVTQGKQKYVAECYWTLNHYNVNTKQLQWMANSRYKIKSFKGCEDKGMQRYQQLIQNKCQGKCSDRMFKVVFGDEETRKSLCHSQNIHVY